MNIGIFGGSFNPIHSGHLAIARAALEQCRLDEVWLMVSPQNPLKQQSELLDDSLRFEMAQKALEGINGVIACDYEFYLPKPSYTWWKDILRNYDVVVYPRDNYHGTIDVPLIPVSSTEIRQKVGAGESIKGMVPDSIVPLVEKYYK